MTASPLPIAIVGAGLACARRLHEAGRPVVLIDKGRMVGGRVSTRRVLGVGAFDHGATYLALTDPRVEDATARLRAAGLLAAYRAVAKTGPGVLVETGWERWVAVPAMSMLPRLLGEGLEAHVGQQVSGLRGAAGAWFCDTVQGRAFGPFSQVVVTAPAPQTAALLAPHAPALAARALEAEMAPCWTLMAAWDQPLDVDFDVFEGLGGPLYWCGRESARPGRAGGERWVLQAESDWSRERLEWTPEAIVAPMLEAFEALVGKPLPPPRFTRGHRWRYARSVRPVGEAYLLDEAQGLMAAGDWCLGTCMSHAYMSGVAAGERLAGVSG